MSMAADGSTTIEYNTGETSTLDYQLKFIDEVSLSNQGVFTVKYNNGDPDYTTTLKWVARVDLDTGDIEGEGTQKVVITFSDGTTETIGNPINYIMKTTINPLNHHLLVMYSDPERRAATDTVTYNNEDGWTDLGAVKSEDGILIGFHIQSSDLGGLTPVNYLNVNYPNGLTDANIAGRVVTATIDDKEFFYAFDYNKNQWYSLGSLGTINSTILVGSETDPETQAIAGSMLTRRSLVCS